jgi:hypothetical protein
MTVSDYSLAMPESEFSNSPFASFSVIDSKMTPMKGETYD